MFKKHRFNIGLTLLVQSASFVVLFFMLYAKKKSLANTFLALSAIGGVTGAYLILKEAKSEVEACEQAAKDAMEAGNAEDVFDFDECDGCFGDCSACTGAENECEITIEEYFEEEPIETTEEVFTEEIADVEPMEEVVAEEPAEDIFTVAAE